MFIKLNESTKNIKEELTVKKLITAWILVVCMLMSMGVVAFATGSENADTVPVGDVYELSPADWPARHWVFMTEEEIEGYEANGWERYVGVIWYDANKNVMTNCFVKPKDVQKLYNEGCTFHVMYTWVCSAENCTLKSGEQSVSVGRWILSPEQATEYHKTYVKPELKILKMVPTISFESQFYYNGLACEVTGEEEQRILDGVKFVRYKFDSYDYGYGSKLYLRNGEYDEYTFAEALEAAQNNAFQNELPAWK